MSRPRPRVLYASFDPVPSPKGASAHILQTVSAIAGLADVDLLTLPGTLPDASLPAAVRHIPFRPPGDNFLQRALEFGDEAAARLLSAEYAVVHVRSIWEGTPALLLQPRRQYRLVYEVNGLPSVELKHHYPGLEKSRDLLARLRSQERALLRAAAVVITQSHTTRKFLRGRGAGGDRVRVIPNGVDPERFSPPAPKAPAAERPGAGKDAGASPPPAWGAPEPPAPAGSAGGGPNVPVPQVLYLGTLAPWQGVPFLIEAIRLVVGERPVTLRVVGTGRSEWRKECERLVRKLGLQGQVELLPAVPPAEVPALLAQAAVCAAPLKITDRNVLQGCCPIKILEYMAAGRAIAAARLPAVEEVLTDGETALLYKPDKPRRLAEALLRLLADPELRGRLGAAAARRVRERFTWERHNAAVAAVYEELLADG